MCREAPEAFPTNVALVSEKVFPPISMLYGGWIKKVNIRDCVTFMGPLIQHQES